jgi:hypothetical protein
VDPQSEPSSEATARAAQLAAMSLSVVEALARLHAQRQIEQRTREQQRATQRRAAIRTARAAARLGWAPATSRRWLRHASSHELLAAWSSARPWSASDPVARIATTRIEQRLHEMHPEMMHRYHQARAAGVHPDAAMRSAAAAFPQRAAIDMPRGDTALRRAASPFPDAPPDSGGESGTRAVVILGESFPSAIDEALTAVSGAGRTEPIRVTSLPPSRPRQRPRTPGGPT